MLLLLAGYKCKSHYKPDSVKAYLQKCLKIHASRADLTSVVLPKPIFRHMHIGEMSKGSVFIQSTSANCRRFYLTPV